MKIRIQAREVYPVFFAHRVNASAGPVCSVAEKTFIRWERTYGAFQKVQQEMEECQRVCVGSYYAAKNQKTIKKIMRSSPKVQECALAHVLKKSIVLQEDGFGKMILRLARKGFRSGPKKSTKPAIKVKHENTKPGS